METSFRRLLAHNRRRRDDADRRNIPEGFLTGDRVKEPDDGARGGRGKRHVYLHLPEYDYDSVTRRAKFNINRVT